MNFRRRNQEVSQPTSRSKSGLEPKPPHEKSWLAQSGERKGAGLRKRDPFFVGDLLVYPPGKPNIAMENSTIGKMSFLLENREMSRLLCEITGVFSVIWDSDSIFMGKSTIFSPSFGGTCLELFSFRIEFQADPSLGMFQIKPWESVGITFHFPWEVT